ncbi:MAG: cytochrome c-type biogenesis protein CcmH [Gemmatimonadetes bacterium]|nr:cytochrome c-type biogenesis protein CcmH [Gemmatimonadota bacterium]
MRISAGLAAVTIAVALIGTPAFATAAQIRGASAEQEDGAARPELARRVAADSALEARATRLAAELRCPVCQGLSIQDSPSPLALQMKDLIRTQVGQGRSDAEIRGYFVSRYGEWVLLQPRARGFNLLVYILPAMALVAGFALVLLAIKKWTVPAGERRASLPDG